jgi:hypothetical protein
MVRYCVYAASAGGVFAIIGTRLHYTLDVLIAIYISAQVWFTYHWLASNPQGSFRILSWLEHAEVHVVDLDAYRKARRSGNLELEKKFSSELITVPGLLLDPDVTEFAVKTKTVDDARIVAAAKKKKKN